ncbi:MAG: hypothetical protein AAGD07_14755 [Planctomycetota bacterium]
MPAATAGGSLFDPYQTPTTTGPFTLSGTPAGSIYGGNGLGFGTTIPQAPLGSFPSGSTAVPTSGGFGNPAYPNGSLLGGLFSGSLFRSGQGLGGPPVSGVGYPQTIYPPVSPNTALTPGGTGGLGAWPPTTSYADPFPASAYPSGTPNSLFPNGLFNNAYGAPSGRLPFGLGNYQFLHGPRLRHMWLSGGDESDSLGMNQTDVSVGFAFPNFLWTTRPLYVVPGFSLYLFDGPVRAPATGQSLPSNAYGAYLDFGWATDPNQLFGGELGVRVGAYTDFDHFNSNSLRVQGKGLVSFRLTPASTIKGGVYYYDRYRVKLLPAGGWLYQPNPFTRLDVFFPEPKWAQYWQTLGVYDVWGYLAGRYGGDSWTIESGSNDNNRVDLNQIEVMLGWEWGRSELIRTGQRTGFFEVGLATDSELRYEVNSSRVPLDTTFFLRTGFGY